MRQRKNQTRLRGHAGTSSGPPILDILEPEFLTAITISMATLCATIDKLLPTQDNVPDFHCHTEPFGRSKGAQVPIVTAL